LPAQKRLPNRAET